MENIPIDLNADTFNEVTVKRMHKNHKFKNPEAKIFCHAPSKQESSPVRILNKVIINKLINNKCRK